MDSFKARSGWILVDRSTANGGVRYTRTPVEEHSINRGDGIQATHETVKEVDHVAFVKEIDRLVKHTEYILRKTCAQTPVGYFASDEILPKVREEIERLVHEASALNASASIAGCARRARIQIVPIRVDLDTEEAAQEIAKHIRESLTALRNLLRQGETGTPWHNALGRAKNLPTLATGVQADSITFGLENAQAEAKAIRETVKNGAAPKVAGAYANLDALQAAIDLFSASGESLVMESEAA